jgi:hypothetical protein
MAWSWQEEGFAAPPTPLKAPEGTVLYRAWGGSSSKEGHPHRPGVCLSIQRPASRLDAERLFSVWEWGNSCLWLTAFRVTPGTELYVGSVDPGAILDLRLAGRRKGVQVFVENPIAGKLIEAATTRLVDDLGGFQVMPGPKMAQ